MTKRSWRVGTSGWSYKDWVGPFYEDGTRPGDFLPRYAESFDTVEVDSTFYRIPSIRTVEGWSRKTPDDFRFALKVPSTVTHGAQGERPVLDKVLRDESGDLDTFLEAIQPLGEKAAVVLFQFPYFRVRELECADFLDRLAATLERLPKEPRFAVEVRNKTWITAELLDLLRRHRVAAVLLDHLYMPSPRAQVELGMVTTDFVYVRLLGDRYGIEKITTTWEKTVVDKEDRLERWADVLVEIAARHGVGMAWVFANNHFAGHGPATVRRFVEITLSR